MPGFDPVTLTFHENSNRGCKITKSDENVFADLSTSTVIVRKKEGTVVAKKKDGCHVVDVVNSPAQDLNFHGR